MRNKPLSKKWKYQERMFLGGGGNYLLKRGGYTISYQPNARSNLSFFNGDCNERPTHRD